MGFPNNEKLTQGLALLSYKYSLSVTTAVLTPAIDLSKNRKVLFIVGCGALVASETITFLIQGCATSGGSYTTITGSTFTLLKSATDDTKCILIEINAEDVNNLALSYRYIQGSVAGAQGSPVNMYALGAGGPEEPMSNNNIGTTVLKSVNNV